MRPPFPGMDPWLENPDLWPDVHNSLIVSIRDVLSANLRPRYFVGVESRMTVLSGPDHDQIYYPDVAIRRADIVLPERERGVAVRERIEAETFHVVLPMVVDEIEEAFLTIKELPSRRLVTVVEVLSPTNKKAKGPRKDYMKKRRELLESGVNLVEIDLLRSGKRMPPERIRHSSDYRILIFRPRQSRDAHLYGFSYKTEIPPIPIPLVPEDTEPTLDLNGVLHGLYDRAGYDLAINYRQPPQPRLRKGDEAWAQSIIARALGEIPQAPARGETSP
jgi:hypothetical protein